MDFIIVVCFAPCRIVIRASGLRLWGMDSVSGLKPLTYFFGIWLNDINLRAANFTYGSLAARKPSYWLAASSTKYPGFYQVHLGSYG